MNIKVDVNQLINDIAKSLGVAAEKVYPILYKQMIINGIYSLLLVIMSIIGLFAAWYLHRKLKLKIDDNNKKKPSYSYLEEDWSDYPGHVIAIVFGLVISSIVLIISAKLALDYLFNPDLQVINYVVNKLK